MNQIVFILLKNRIGTTNIPWRMTHDHHYLVDTFSRVTHKSLSYCLKIYFLFYFVPLILFKSKKLRKNPKKTLKAFVRGLGGSMAFISGFAFLSQIMICGMKEFKNPVNTSKF